MSIHNSDIILAANRAMLSYIHSNIREISIEYIHEEKKINFFVYFDGKPTEDQIDDMGNIVTEMSCQFPSEIIWKEQIITLNYPKRIPSKGICVFQRHETSQDDSNSR